MWSPETHEHYDTTDAPSGAQHPSSAGGNISKTSAGSNKPFNANQLRLPLVALISVVALCGFAMMTISLNFWLQKFRYGKGPFTIAAITAMSWDAILLTVFFLYIAFRRPGLQFLFSSWRTWVLLAVIGFFEAASGLFTAYAAGHISEYIQTALMATVVPMTVIFSFCIIPNYRRDKNVFDRFAISSGVFLVSGIFVLIISQNNSNKKPQEEEEATAWWICVYFLSAAQNAIHFVLQSKFMNQYTRKFGFEAVSLHSPQLAAAGTQNTNDEARLTSFTHIYAVTYNPEEKGGGNPHGSVATGGGGTGSTLNITPPNEQEMQCCCYSPTSSSNGGEASRKCCAQGYAQLTTGGDFTVKITMLAIDTFFQILATFLLLPLDAVHGFGKSENVSDSWNNFEDGMECVFNNNNVCPSNTVYYILFLVGFAVSHFAATYLNHFSASYTSIILMLQSPVTTTILILIPSWNAHKGEPIPLWGALISCALLLASAMTFGFWEKKYRSLDTDGAETSSDTGGAALGSSSMEGRGSAFDVNAKTVGAVADSPTKKHLTLQPEQEDAYM